MKTHSQVTSDFEIITVFNCQYQRCNMKEYIFYIYIYICVCVCVCVCMYVCILEYLNPTPTEPERCRIIKEYVYFATSCQQMCTGQLFSFYHKKKVLAFSTVIDPGTGFLSEHVDVNRLHSTPLVCDNLRVFDVCHLRGPFVLSLDATKDRDWSFCFFIS